MKKQPAVDEMPTETAQQRELRLSSANGELNRLGLAIEDTSNPVYVFNAVLLCETHDIAYPAWLRSRLLAFACAIRDLAEAPQTPNPEAMAGALGFARPGRNAFVDYRKDLEIQDDGNAFFVAQALGRDEAAAIAGVRQRRNVEARQARSRVKAGMKRAGLPTPTDS